MNQQTNVYYYQCHTSAGTVGLIPEPNGRYKVMFGNENLGSCHSAEAAADDVSGGHTFALSDGTHLGALDIPSDLADWGRKLFASIQRHRRG